MRICRYFDSRFAICRYYMQIYEYLIDLIGLLPARQPYVTLRDMRISCLHQGPDIDFPLATLALLFRASRYTGDSCSKPEFPEGRRALIAQLRLQLTPPYLQLRSLGRKRATL